MKNLKSQSKMYEASLFAIAFLLAMLLKPAPKLVSLEYIQQTSRFIEKADLNGDEREDIVAIAKDGNRLYYFLNMDSGKYEEHYLASLETRTPRASLTVKSKDETSWKLSFLVSFQPIKLELKLEDKDKDGDVDIFISDLRRSRWFINDGKGKFTKKYERAHSSLRITYSK